MWEGSVFDAPMAVPQHIEEPVEEPVGPSAASRCRVSGNGLSNATVRQEASFTIEAFDESERRKDEGGDAFFVSIRGPGTRIRAKVDDHGDGSYTVRFKPEVSGKLMVAISLYGDELAGSPFFCHVHTPTPKSFSCTVRGPALHTAIARMQHHFEISFRDATGQIAHAEDLDVYVEAVAPLQLKKEEVQPENTSQAAPDAASQIGSSDAVPVTDASLGALAATASFDISIGDGEDDVAPSVEPVPTSPLASPGTPTDRQRNAAAGAKSMTPRKPKAGRTEKSLQASASHARIFKTKGIPQLGLDSKTNPTADTSAPWRECVITSRAPLVVRADRSLESDRICQLLPGKRVYVLKTQQSNSGTRALVAVDSDELDVIRQAEAEWRATHCVRPEWIDESFRRVMRHRVGAQPLRSPRKALIGWVTVSKDGREFVTQNCQLMAGERQLHMQAWNRRLALDKSIDRRNAARDQLRRDKDERSFNGGSGVASAKKLRQLATTKPHDRVSQFQKELASDPSGIGFAFGGIEPGRLHAHGRVVEWHKVFYSIGLVGTYRLHVALRHQSMPIPGSPFDLSVVPGPANAGATVIPDDVLLPLHGTVGKEEQHGCHLKLQARDEMGNPCVEGGAKVSCSCLGVDTIEASITDNGDGTYALVWRSQQSGTFNVQIWIDKEQVASSPCAIKLLSDTPDLSKTSASGPGLGKVVTAGLTTQIRLRLLDKYSNVACTNDSLEFGLTKGKWELKEHKDEKVKWKTKQSERFDGRWVDDEYEISYCPKQAGDTAVYLWTAQNGTRELIPGSPFRTMCVSGDADAGGSRLEGLSKEEPVVSEGKSKNSDQKQSGSKSEKPVEDGNNACGETIVLRPVICDAFGNFTTLQNDDLSIVIAMADGSQKWELEPEEVARSGMTAYEARFEPKVQGQYVVHVCLAGIPIKGSPMHVNVHAGTPDIGKSEVILPEGQLWAQHQGQVFAYDITLVAVDKHGNKCTNGGANVTCRLGGSNAPQDPNVDVEDLDNGRYVMSVSVKAAGDLKLYIATGGSESEFKLTFLNRATALQKEQREKTGGTGRRTSVSPDVLAQQIAGLDGGGPPGEDSSGTASPKAFLMSSANALLTPLAMASMDSSDSFTL